MGDVLEEEREAGVGRFKRSKNSCCDPWRGRRRGGGGALGEREAEMSLTLWDPSHTVVFLEGGVIRP